MSAFYGEHESITGNQNSGLVQHLGVNDHRIGVGEGELLREKQFGSPIRAIVVFVYTKQASAYGAITT